jgi:hypothetical protein
MFSSTAGLNVAREQSAVSDSDSLSFDRPAHEETRDRQSRVPGESVVRSTRRVTGSIPPVQGPIHESYNGSR